MKTKWWGWGAPDKQYPLDERPAAWLYLRKQLGVAEEVTRAPVALDEIQLPPSRVGPEVMEALALAVGEVNLTTQARDRLTHAYGRSYRDLVRLRAGILTNPPDAVVFPTQEGQVEAVLAAATQYGFAVIPFGGGTSVVGGLEMPTEQRDRPYVSLDLTRLAEIVSVDPESQLATVQAGIMGPRLEEALQARGFTLGHYPQSFEFSTLGGWVATRSAGQQSTRYGKIERMVLGLRLVTPTGVLETRPVPASAQGPDLNQVAIGSEGLLGVITQVTVQIHAVPERKHYRALIFPDWQRGRQAVREILQGDRHPATLRLSDVAETEALFKLRESRPSPARDFVQAAVKWYLRRLKGIESSRGCLMIIGFEGSHDEVEQCMHACKDVSEHLGGFDLGHGIGEKWYASRFELPYLRDTLLDRGILVDTLETCATWENLDRVHQGVTAALVDAIRADGLSPVVFCHLSHAYHSGASLYFTFAARQLAGDEIDQWARYKTAATEAIVHLGGALSHHHGVGLDHAPWIDTVIGHQGRRWLTGLKATADPQGLMNPGKILGPDK